MSMARLWRDQGKPSERAIGLRWFTEGFDTIDLKETEALLDTLVREVEKRSS